MTGIRKEIGMKIFKSLKKKMLKAEVNLSEYDPTDEQVTQLLLTQIEIHYRTNNDLIIKVKTQKDKTAIGYYSAPAFGPGDCVTLEDLKFVSDISF